MFEQIESVHTASRFDQRVERAPASVTVVSGEEIRRYGYRTLGEVLQSVGGFFAADDHNYVTLGVRGLARPGDFNTRVLFLLDGRRLNDPVFDSALLGTESPLDVELIERIEVVRGPSSSVYGANGLFAVVNIVSRSGRDFEGAEAALSLGTLDTAGARFTWGRRGTRGLETLLSGSYHQSDGATFFFPELFEVDGGRSAPGMDRDWHGRLFGKASRGDFTLTAAWVRRGKRIPTGAYEVVFNDPRTETVDETGVVDLRWSRTLRSRDALDARVFYNRSVYDGTYPYEQAGPGEPSRVELLLDGARGERLGLELQHTLRPRGRHRLLWGAELRDDFRQEQTIEAPAYHFDRRRHTWAGALFAQDEVALGPRVTLNAGGRLDRYQAYGTSASPRLALIVDAGREATVKLLFGRAFRPPNTYEREYDDGTIQKGNPGLDGESILAWEASYQRPFGRRLKGSLGAYYYRLSGLIGQEVDPEDGRLLYANGPLIEAPGVEAELEALFGRALEARASWAWQRAQVEDGTRLTNSPEHLGRLGLSSPLSSERLTLSVEGLFSSPRRTLRGRRTASFLVVNGTLLARRLARGLSASFTLANMLDAEYAFPGGEEHLQDALPQRGRTLRLEAWYAF